MFNLQKQVKDNAGDLNNFYNDLRNWSEEMKRKESGNKSEVKSKKQIDPMVKKKKISGPSAKVLQSSTDYKAWDKFDADAECEKVDEKSDDDSELTDENDQSLLDEAYVEKDKGNKFVKASKWDKAIECYTKAIDFYSYDPVFYANRALCFLKTTNYSKAEIDCDFSIQLDGTYVKAFQRRAVAKEALGKLKEAESDYLKVLELEPKNQETLNSLKLLRANLPVEEIKNDETRPVSKFMASRKNKNEINRNLGCNNSGIKEIIKLDCQLTPPLRPKTDDDLMIIKAISKPVHMQSKKPLKRIEIEEISSN